MKRLLRKILRLTKSACVRWAHAKTGEFGQTSVDIVVGVGNPGSRYAQTRHNLGFDVVDALARRYDIVMQQRLSEAICGQGTISQRAVLLVKPQTYMNASGRAVAPLVQKYMGRGDRLVVIHDDIDLPLGRIKVKRHGGDAGHLGVRSIIACLGHGEFLRLRMVLAVLPVQHTLLITYCQPLPLQRGSRARR